MERDVFNSDPNTRRKTKRIKEAKRKVTLKDKLIKYLKTKGFQDDLWMKKHLDKQSLDKQRLKLKRD